MTCLIIFGCKCDGEDKGGGEDECAKGMALEVRWARPRVMVVMGLG